MTDAKRQSSVGLGRVREAADKLARKCCQCAEGTRLRMDTGGNRGHNEGCGVERDSRTSKRRTSPSLDVIEQHFFLEIS
jgi:hypothetical protein